MQNTVEIRLTSEEVDTTNVELLRLEGRESLNTLFRVDVECACPHDDGFVLSEALGSIVTVEMLDDGQLVRELRCLVADANNRLATEAHRQRFRLGLVPLAHRLTMVRTQEVFLHQSVPDIIAAKLDLCMLEYDFRLMESYPPREFVVQYAESDIAFISRLCEHHGIAFHFEQIDGRQRIVFSDSGHFLRLADDRAVIPFRARGERLDVYELSYDQILIPQHYVVADYNYRTPQIDLAMASSSEVGTAGGIVEYGGHFKTEAQGQRLAEIRREAQECRRIRYQGTSARPDIGAGVRFQLDGHPSAEVSDFLVVESRYRYATTPDNEGPVYEHHFVAIDGALPFRPERVTPWPRIHGIISGIVEARPGTDGTRPWLDEDGRYRVKLLFDTAPASEKASRAVRMAQEHAGSGYGTHFPLRPGVEVLLAFIDGDVDRPIIIGAVPNAITPTPVTENHHMRHRIRTAAGIQIEFKDGY